MSHPTSLSRYLGPLVLVLGGLSFGPACLTNNPSGPDATATQPSTSTTSGAAGQPNSATPVATSTTTTVPTTTNASPATTVSTPGSLNTASTPAAGTPTAAAAVAAIPWPNLGFVNNPGGNDTKAVALSFDDGPDGTAPNPWGKASPSNMSYMLDQLDKLGLKATFFLCGGLWTNVLTDPQAQTDIQRMVTSGHAFGSHTFTHTTLAANTQRNLDANYTPVSLAQVQNEFTQNQSAFANASLLGPTNSPFTMWRAPYGYPFQDGIVYPPTASSIVDDVTGIAPATPPNAVHVGWGIDTKDWQCAQANSDSNCILTNLNTFLGAGASGVILMHSVYKLSADTLPQVAASIYSHGYHIVMVEDFIRAKYGASSAQIAAANANVTFDANTVNAAAVAAAMQSKWYSQTNED